MSSFPDLNCYKLDSADAVYHWRNVTERIECINKCRTVPGKKNVIMNFFDFIFISKELSSKEDE
jgi:hypothetical protein